jgi:cell division protein FtsQ
MARALAAPSSSTHARPALAGGADVSGGLTQARAIPMPTLGAAATAPLSRRSERRGWRVWRAKALAVARTPGFGSALALTLLLCAAAAGAVCGGQYRAFVGAEGSIEDVLARTFGFGIDAVTITGARELTVKEILDAAGIDPRGSLLFANAAEMRQRLLAVPLVKEASVHKLFPDRLVIAITERQPFALWQKDGTVEVVAADGTPIDQLRDRRFDALPFVVGDDANEHLAEFMSLLQAAGDLRSQIRAGVYVGDRRWNLNLKNGMEIRLPEVDPQAALAELAEVADRSQLLDKDLLTIDMRIPGRMVVRISEQAEAARAKVLAKQKKWGTP